MTIVALDFARLGDGCSGDKFLGVVVGGSSLHRLALPLLCFSLALLAKALHTEHSLTQTDNTKKKHDKLRLG